MQERHFRLALLVLGHGVFIALLALAWQHAMLRSTFGDTAFQVFQWISQPGWDIEAHRYTAIVPQACVKFCALFAPELHTLLLVASLAHALVAYTIYLICAHVWKAPVAAFGCALAAVLCSRLAFYSPVLEANYLLCYPFLLIGYLERTARSGAFPPLARAASLVFLSIPLIVHPSGWMVMLFCTVFLTAPIWPKGRGSTMLIILCLAWPALAPWLFPPTGYEQEQYDAIARGLRSLDSMARWGSTDFLVIHTFRASSTYMPALLVALAVVAGWAWLRQWRIALLTLGGVAAFLFTFLVTFHTGNAAIMQDRGVLPVATIIALSASALVARAERPALRIAVVSIAALVLFVKVRDVSFASRPFKNQYAAVETFIDLADRQQVVRGLVDRRVLEERGVEVSWALPVETLLRSAARGPAQGRVIVCSDTLSGPEWPGDGRIPVLHFLFDPVANGNPYFKLLDPSYVPLFPH